MRDYENPTHVPRLPLKIIAGAYVLWLVILPIIAALRKGQAFDLPLMVAGGLTLTGIVLLFMFIQRLLLWMWYTFYWYVMAALGMIFLLCGGLYLVGIFSIPVNPPVVNVPASFDWVLWPGAILGIVALVLVFRPGGKPSVPPAVVTPEPSPAPKPTAPPIDPIAERRRKLGLDK